MLGLKKFRQYVRHKMRLDEIEQFEIQPHFDGDWPYVTIDDLRKSEKVRSIACTLQKQMTDSL